MQGTYDRQMHRALPWLIVTALAVSGCASVAPPPAGPAAPAGADVRTGSAEALVVERQWLQTWFSGTPVVITQRADGGVDIDVPEDFCFEPGRSKVMPALGAVLDKVAESLRRAPRVQVVMLAAPGDPAGAAPLALQRADQIASALRARGVSAARLGKPVAAALPAVRLRLQTPAT